MKRTESERFDSASQYDRHRLYTVDDMSRHFRELFIFTGYRFPRSTFVECLQSAFKLNNETMNIWTHFLPTLYFIWCMWVMWDDLDLGHDPHTTPMITYLLSSCLFPAMSAMAHVFNAMSDHARHFCFFLDYWALSWYSFCVAIVYRFYTFPESLQDSAVASYFVPLTFINGLGCMLLACHSRFLEVGPCRKLLRFLAFAVPYWFDSIPIFYRIIYCSPQECASPALFYYTRQFIYTFLSAFMYSTHLPERAWPGKFDIFGHSHQIFHVLVVLGARDQMIALNYDIDAYRRNLDPLTPPPDPVISIGLMVTLAILNSLILAFYTFWLHGTLMPGETWDSPQRFFIKDKIIEECNGNVRFYGGSDADANGHGPVGLWEKEKQL